MVYNALRNMAQRERVKKKKRWRPRLLKNISRDETQRSVSDFINGKVTHATEQHTYQYVKVIGLEPDEDQN
ncbi:hypothetical protein NDU88_002197 [Pleurodeles waltl]|uniref:Uncharacterized protein n=1 Tax=Pleurodeles waltl TaxID=8319 RepID=A0AAV7VD53_PLEWA|nr:hypothetical protein NDU88_002197 [Pleurodeles waltl]